MADTKLTDLTELNATPAIDDVFYIADITAGSAGSRKLQARYLWRTDGTAAYVSGGGTVALGGYILTVPASGTAVIVDATQTLTSKTINAATLGTPTITGGTATSLTLTSAIIDGTLNNATIGTPTITGGTWTGGTVNTSALGTPTATGGTWTGGTVNTAAIGTPTVTGGTFTTPTINTATVGTPTITGGSMTGATVDTATVGTPTITGGTWTGGTINTATVGTPTVTGGSMTGATIDTATMGTPTVTGGTWTGGTINSAIMGTPTVSGGTFTGGTVNTATLGTPTVSGGTFQSLSAPLCIGVDATTAGSALMFAHDGTGGYAIVSFSLAGTAGTVGFTAIPDGDYDIKSVYYVRAMLSSGSAVASLVSLSQTAINTNVTGTVSSAVVTVDSDADGSLVIRRSGTTGTVTGMAHLFWV